MKSLLSTLMVLMFGAMMVGCHADAGVDANDTSDGNKQVHEKTVTDANGNVVEHQKTVEHY